MLNEICNVTNNLLIKKFLSIRNLHVVNIFWFCLGKVLEEMVQAVTKSIAVSYEALWWVLVESFCIHFLPKVCWRIDFLQFSCSLYGTCGSPVPNILILAFHLGYTRQFGSLSDLCQRFLWLWAWAGKEGTDHPSTLNPKTQFTR